MPKFAKPVKVPIKLLTPVWTGDASGRANGLKMSGIIGGMRHNFEMLVRKYGGHTCNITGEASQRCNYEKDPNICPACAVFGCTGLQRSFKLRLDFKPVTFIPPLKDPILPNRRHDGSPYKWPVMISKWLLVSAGLAEAIGDIKKDEAVPGLINQIKPAWPQKENGDTDFVILPLNSFLSDKHIDLMKLINHLLVFMASYTGLGAKINQGWGLFHMTENAQHSESENELKRLISICDYKGNSDNGLPNASDCFAATWTISGTEFGFEWPKQEPVGAYQCTGFALVYRLRRYMKFYENDNPGKKIFDLPGGHAWDTDWRNIGNGLSGKWSRSVWKETLPFIRILFGRDEADDQTKTSGLLGVSHLFRANDKWQVRLIGRISSLCCYRDWDARKKKDTSTALNWDTAIVRESIIKRFQELLTRQNVWSDIDPGPLKKTGGDI